MPPRRSAATTDEVEIDASVSFQLGQISGQLRELVHNVANLQSTATAIGLRVAALEASDNRREGASSLLRTIIKSAPLAWLVGAVVTAWAVLTGRVHL